jgi:G:T/U-mismatch repair DNA glycosylase
MADIPERHPLAPFTPEGARILMLGSFPPKKEKWSMDWFYPNWINDMWRIVGYVFYNDKEHFVAEGPDGKKIKSFDKEKIVEFCEERGLALYDTATEVIRLKDNASDKFLQIVRPTDISALLQKMPSCNAVVTTGQKATDTLIQITGCDEPAIGSWTDISICGRSLRFWRMPSSSRAYPLSLEKKAEHYSRMFHTEEILVP